MRDQANAIENDPVTRLFRVTDYGAKPDSGEDATRAIQAAIDAASAMEEPAVIEFPLGRYDLYPVNAAQAPYYVSNTVSEDEHPDPTKTIGLWFKGASRIRVEGNGSRLLFHGKMTPIVMDGCVDAEIRNLTIDFARPTISEIRIAAIGESYWDVEVHPDSYYLLKDDKLHWVGEGWSYRGGPAQEYDPVSNRTWRVPNPVTLANHVEQLELGKLRLRFASAPFTTVGHVFQMRDGIRDQVGSLIVGCRNIIWQNVWMQYMHGLGIVGQFSENLTLEGLRLAPDPSEGRTAAGFADFVHLSGMKGKVSIVDSEFEGAHDDAINVHGTHLRIVGVEDGKRVRVRFMHPQTYGFNAFHPGDEIDFISARALTSYATRQVIDIKQLSLREAELTLDALVPETIGDEDVVENVTWTPEVSIRGNVFKRIPTRGILVTTRRKVTIENNSFEKLHMSAILIADDAESWFESGMVRHVRIRGNRFIACGGGTQPVILIHPENTLVSADAPVHSNVVISGNRFELDGSPLLDAKSTHDLIVADNQISRNGVMDGESADSQEIVRLWACSGVEIVGNTFEDNGVAIVKTISMRAKHLAIDTGQAAIIRRDYEDEI
ncbi:right-handed parallel beta-helix repeat-containing protein [Cohnella herbarum]|uniref:Right-handed parallel beta-helix repeat-containing protein n=1 Tax=Cohnella herbarum TaxID=2728023 RepID=A0A7Z2VPI5_9BACL|nr:right-handed parallel beta-helix repeat-containing protein [Cohnella herbarum]QJD87108.1 right-handed parallel beta-helix repeat-containing protein [Cohnella herbarum]